MSDHSSSVFNNSCLKLPRNPKSNYPLPGYEQKYLNQLHNETTKLNLESNCAMSAQLSKKSKQDAVKSFLDFYDSIPEYDDVNHLSNREFYKKVEMLKEKQRSYFNYVENENKLNKNTEWLEEYKNVGKKKKASKSVCTTPILTKSPKMYKRGVDSEISSVKDLALKPPSRRSVRIETPSDKLSPETPDIFHRSKSRLNVSSESSNKGHDDWDDLSMDTYKLDLDRSPGRSRSACSTPTKGKPSVGWKDNSITIPKPFEMTVRDEENKIVEDLLIEIKRPKSEKQEMFKAHPVPIESMIPLFDKVMEDQERKNYIVRERSKAQLQAQMRPFSFTKRDEEIQRLTSRLSKSSPTLFLDDPPMKIKKFKAKPVPKNLFSNYIYKKMHEDEFYRALQKKIRAEEMLKAASLPPSMAMREKSSPKYEICPRSSAVFERNKAPKKNRKGNYKETQDFFDREFEELKNEFLSKPTNRRQKKSKKAFRNSSASSCESRTVSSSELQSVSRSNLAAVLRIESARKRVEAEMGRRLEESKLKEEARWREQLMRKKPVWHTLAYSHEEDLAMRLQLRRDEEKLRNEEHRLRMQLMLGRVNQQPTLFERQSQLRCPKSRAELVSRLYPASNCKRRSLSDLSDARSFVAEMKDEAIQAFLDEEIKQESDKETLREEKEKCESLSSEDEEGSN